MSYYAAGQWDLAVEGFRDFIQKFPNAPDAADAQFFIGESYYQSGKTREALAAYTAVPTTYKDSTRVPDAYFKQASCNELLSQRAEAIRVYQLIVKQYPESSAAPARDAGAQAPRRHQVTLTFSISRSEGLPQWAV